MYAPKDRRQSHDVRFSPPNVPMIIGEIRRYLRDNNAMRVSRSIRDVAYHAMQEKEKLVAKLGRDPTVEEIAKAMNMDGKVRVSINSFDNRDEATKQLLELRKNEAYKNAWLLAK